MKIINKTIEIETQEGINIYNVTPKIKEILYKTSIVNGQVVVFSQHTTTALAINEDEKRLLEDIKVHLEKLVPKSLKYLHNDIHLRDAPADEPKNAHSHLIAITLLNTSEVIPIVDGNLALGTWQSILFVELDGPRKRTLLLQFIGQPELDGMLKG